MIPVSVLQKKGIEPLWEAIDSFIIEDDEEETEIKE